MNDAGKLPPGWTVAPISEITTSIGGGTPPTTDPAFWEGGKTPWVSPKDMKVFRLRDTIDSVTERALERLTVVPPSSVLVVVRSGILEHSLPVAINDRSVVLNQDMRAFVPLTDVNAAFIAWQLVANGGEILERCTKDGTTVASIEAPRLAAFELKLAPAPEQVRVVEGIDSLLSALDAATRDLETAKRKLTLCRQSLLKSAVEGRLTAELRDHLRSGASGAELLAQILIERALATKRNATVPDIAGAPPLPKGWVWASLDQLLQSLRSGTAETSGRAATQFPVLKSSAVRHGSIDYTQLNYLNASQSRAENFLAAGDLLITRLSGSVEYVGCAAMVESERSPGVQYPDRVFCGKPVSSAAALMPFVVLCFEAGLIRERIETAAKSTAGHKRISMSDLRPLPIPIPPLDEAVRIIETCGTALESAQDLAQSIDRQLTLIAAQRRNILRAAFSGQLVPQDPNDEPASVLLERIRACRQAAAPAPKRKPGRPTKAAP